MNVMRWRVPWALCVGSPRLVNERAFEGYARRRTRAATVGGGGAYTADMAAALHASHTTPMRRNPLTHDDGATAGDGAGDGVGAGVGGEAKANNDALSAGAAVVVTGTVDAESDGSGGAILSDAAAAEGNAASSPTSPQQPQQQQVPDSDPAAQRLEFDSPQGSTPAATANAAPVVATRGGFDTSFVVEEDESESSSDSD